MERPRSRHPAPRQTDDRYLFAFENRFTVSPYHHQHRYPQMTQISQIFAAGFFLCAICDICGQVHARYLSFSDPIEISARMIPTIQNRTMTFDSGHPICSK